MGKVIFRETIISLLVSIAVLLILSLVFYKYIPSNKIIPQPMEYTATKEIQQQLNSEVEDNSNEVIVTYEVTAQDLENFEKIDEYNPGKSNPFAASSDTATGGQTNGNNNSNNGGTTDNKNENQGGSIFEGNNSK